MTEIEVLTLLDDVAQSIRHAMKTIKYDGTLEQLEDQCEIRLESWAVDIETALKKLTANL